MSYPLFITHTGLANLSLLLDNSPGLFFYLINSCNFYDLAHTEVAADLAARITLIPNFFPRFLDAKLWKIIYSLEFSLNPYIIEVTYTKNGHELGYLRVRVYTVCKKKYDQLFG